ncbi:MAG: glycosyltransferase family 4 protein [Bacteroidales bacterium]|nr:glycosyltransferase family 4 protein [Bacteroidales bacterium]
MKIFFIIPGSGDSFYCGNCFRDNLQASALRRAGHEVVVMPLYLPLKQKSFQAGSPLFFPATTYYTAQKFFRKRKMPKWLERVTVSNMMLNFASSLSGTTSAEGMEEMTLSMITGDDRAFREQVTQLVDWIKNQEKPDVIHLSSTLLIGIAKIIRQELDIPVVCSVQDEEVWIDSLDEKYAVVAWQGITDNLQYIDRFVTTSEFYKKELQKRIPQITEVDVVYPGINREKYASPVYPSDPVIGFFYRMNRENGLDILADAFVKLKQKDTVKNLRLKIGGGFTGKDKPFLKQVKKMLSPWQEYVEIEDSYNPDDHAPFYGSITVISVPITFEEGVGLYLCEAFAAGRPAVEPATGSFREIVDDAGIIYEPNNSDALAEALEKILTDEKLMAECRENALSLSSSRYNDRISAEKLSTLYKELRVQCSGFNVNLEF